MRFVEFHQFAQIHEGGLARDAGCLLHVMGDDDDRVFGAQLVDQFLDLGGRERIECRGRLVEEDDLRLDGNGAGDAEALLLAARKAGARSVQLVLDFVPDSGAAQGASTRSSISLLEICS